MYLVVLSLPVTDFTDVFFNTENYVKSKTCPWFCLTKAHLCLSFLSKGSASFMAWHSQGRRFGHSAALGGSGMLLQAQFLLHEHQPAPPHCYTEQWNCRQSGLDWEGSGKKTKSFWKDQFVGDWKGPRCVCCTQVCPEPRCPWHRGGSRNSCVSWATVGGAARCPCLLPPSLTPPGNERGSREGRLSLGGDGVKNNPTAECSLIDINRNIPIK